MPELGKSVAEYVSLLPEEQRTADAVYQARLSLCRACEWLRNGSCALCGCYVEARAAKRGQRCPATPPKWTKSE